MVITISALLDIIIQKKQGILERLNIISAQGIEVILALKNVLPQR